MKFLKGIGLVIAGLLGIIVCGLIGVIMAFASSIAGFIWAGVAVIVFIWFGIWDKKPKKPP